MQKQKTIILYFKIQINSEHLFIQNRNVLKVEHIEKEFSFVDSKKSLEFLALKKSCKQLSNQFGEKCHHNL